MGLRINTNVPALNAGRQLQRNTNQLNSVMRQLSSGLRINSAKDDAAGLAIAEGFNSQVRGAVVAQRNSQDGVSMVQTAEGALGETTLILQRMRELAVQSANGTLTDTNRAAMQGEVTQMIAQINDIAWQTEFNGVQVLSGALSITLQTGYRSGQTMTVTGTSAGAVALKVNNVSISTMTSAVSTLNTLDVAIQSVSTIRSNFGAIQNRLEFTINTLAIQEENSAASESMLRDADMARVTIGFTRSQILVTAGTSVLAQANILPQTALTLLS